MPIRKIVTYPNPALNRKCKPIKSMTREIRSLIKDMLDTLYHTPHAIGLAAIQIGETKRIIVIDMSEAKNEPIILINPKITKKKGKQRGPESCLSVPGMEAEVCRYKDIIVKAKNGKFEDIVIEATDYFSVVLQHEIDHTEGELYVNRAEEGTLKPLEDDAHPV